MISTTFRIIMDSIIKKENSLGIIRKEIALGKIRKMIESLLLKTRSLSIRTQSPKLKTRSLVQKMIKIQIKTGKRILGEYSFKDRSVLGKDRALALCKGFSKNFELLTCQTYNKT